MSHFQSAFLCQSEFNRQRRLYTSPSFEVRILASPEKKNAREEGSSDVTNATNSGPKYLTFTVSKALLESASDAMMVHLNNSMQEGTLNRMTIHDVDGPTFARFLSWLNTQERECFVDDTDQLGWVQRLGVHTRLLHFADRFVITDLIECEGNVIKELLDEFPDEYEDANTDESSEDDSSEDESDDDEDIEMDDDQGEEEQDMQVELFEESETGNIFDDKDDVRDFVKVLANLFEHTPVKVFEKEPSHREDATFVVSNRITCIVRMIIHFCARHYRALKVHASFRQLLVAYPQFGMSMLSVNDYLWKHDQKVLRRVVWRCSECRGPMIPGEAAVTAARDRLVYCILCNKVTALE